MRDEALNKSGTRRIGQPEDVAELALFLAARGRGTSRARPIAVDGGATTGLF